MRGATTECGAAGRGAADASRRSGERGASTSPRFSSARGPGAWLAGCLALLLPLSASQARAPEALERVLASDGEDGDQFGSAVALVGDTALIGAPGADAMVVDQTLVSSGMAYVFARSPGGEWQEEATLWPEVPGEGDRMGAALALSDEGTLAIVGAPGSSVFATNGGVAFAFERDGASWERQEVDFEIFGAGATPVQGDRFGTSVAISGRTVAIGARRRRGPSNDRVGAVFIFNWGDDDPQGGAPERWLLSQILFADAPHAGGDFGRALALEGDTLVVGAPAGSSGSEVETAGSAYVYTRDAAGFWNAERELVNPDASSGDGFGSAVALSGDRILVGAPTRAAGGAAAVFSRDGADWELEQWLRSGDATDVDEFGQAVALDGPLALVGDSRWSSNPEASNNRGSAYVFARADRAGGARWTGHSKLIARRVGNGDRLGSALALDGDTALVGAFRHDPEGPGGRLGGAFEFAPVGGLSPEAFGVVRKGGVELIVNLGDPDALGPAMARIQGGDVPDAFGADALLHSELFVLGVFDETHDVEVAPGQPPVPRTNLLFSGENDPNALSDADLDQAYEALVGAEFDGWLEYWSDRLPVPFEIAEVADDDPRSLTVLGDHFGGGSFPLGSRVEDDRNLAPVYGAATEVGPLPREFNVAFPVKLQLQRNLGGNLQLRRGFIEPVETSDLLSQTYLVLADPSGSREIIYNLGSHDELPGADIAIEVPDEPQWSGGLVGARVAVVGFFREEVERPNCMFSHALGLSGGPGALGQSAIEGICDLLSGRSSDPVALGFLDVNPLERGESGARNGNNARSFASTFGCFAQGALSFSICGVIGEEGLERLPIVGVAADPREVGVVMELTLAEPSGPGARSSSVSGVLIPLP